jgi:leucine dehydrogenase
VYESILVTNERLFGTRDLAGRAMTIVGLGQVGSRLAERLNEAGAKLTVTDVADSKRAFADRLGVDWVEPAQALSVPADIVVPAALGGVLTESTVAELDCKAVVGPANNQLADDHIADVLAARGVLWAPDFLVNAGGVIYGSHMEVGSKDPERAMAAVIAIGATLAEVYDRASSDGITPLAAAQTVALDRIAAAGGRSR